MKSSLSRTSRSSRAKTQQQQQSDLMQSEPRLPLILYIFRTLVRWMAARTPIPKSVLLLTLNAACRQTLKTARCSHNPTGSVEGLIAQHIRWILLLCPSRKTILRLPIDNTWAKEAQAACCVWVAQSVLPLGIKCRIRMGDLAWSVILQCPIWTA